MSIVLGVEREKSGMNGLLAKQQERRESSVRKREYFDDFLVDVGVSENSQRVVDVIDEEVVVVVTDS